jgi:hypothetical protein
LGKGFFHGDLSLLQIYIIFFYIYLFIIKKTMAKKQGKAGASSGLKVTFGVRKGGKHKKFRGPKEKMVSKYRGQGR